MIALGWMHRKFSENHDQQSRNVPTRKSYSCFSTIWGLEQQQYYPEEKTSSAPEANSVKEVKEEAVDISPEFLQAILAIGTLGAISITEESMTPKVSMPFESEPEEETAVIEDEKEVHEVSYESPKGRVVHLNEREGMDTDGNKSTAVLPLPASKQKTMPANLLKKKGTSYKSSLKLDKWEKIETRVSHFMKKMLKKLDFNCRDANFCDSTDKKPAKVLRQSRKVHPEKADHLHVRNSNNYEVNNTSYNKRCDKEVAFEDDGEVHPHDGMLKNETVSCYPTGEKAHWIKTDADYFVLEF